MTKKMKSNFHAPLQMLWMSSVACVLLVWWHYSTIFESYFGPLVANPGVEVKSLVSITTSKHHRKFFPAPEESRKLLWVRKGIKHKLYEPVIRAFHSRGYSLTEDYKRAHFLWTDHPFSKLYNKLKPWQRFSWVPNIRFWDDKDYMAYHMSEYYATKGVNPLHSFPESYLLHREDDLRRFQRRLSDGGINDPWVFKMPTINQGKGVQIVGPHSEVLVNISQRIEVESTTRRVAQRYICDEMTYFGRKFDFRIFWIVASVDPLIVLYQTKHNYVRVGAAAYDETDFSNTQSHLTTHTFAANEGKATWDEFRVYIQKFHTLQADRLSHIEHPFQHLENQVKQVLAHLVDAFMNMTYHSRGISAENAFTWHAADMILDNDLDVYIIEGTDGPGKDEDYEFRIEMHNVIFGDMIDIVEEVVRRQERGLPVDVREMEQDGILGSYEVVFNDGWMFEYTFERPKKQGCGVSEGSLSSENVAVPNEVLKVVQATAPLTALPNRSEDILIKTFFMEGKTRKSCEPIARSLRATGWIPVDDVSAAQLVYEKSMPKDFPQHLQSWQFYNHVPNEKSIFRELQVSEFRRKSCGPLLYNSRRFTVNIYWLVLSLEPLIVFYHDGFLDIPFDENDENEFLFSDQDRLQKDESSRFWRGSWVGFEHLLDETLWEATIRTNMTTTISPMLHVKGQMKKYLVKVAKLLKRLIKMDSKTSEPHSFGIYMAIFDIDRNLHVMQPRISKMRIYSEGYQEMVNLHNDVFGSAFNLLEKRNTTIAGALDPVAGGYELILDSEHGVEFEYTYKGHPMRC
jgi:hypothetical protein